MKRAITKHICPIKLVFYQKYSNSFGPHQYVSNWGHIQGLAGTTRVLGLGLPGTCEVCGAVYQYGSGAGVFGYMSGWEKDFLKFLGLGSLAWAADGVFWVPGLELSAVGGGRDCIFWLVSRD